MKNLLLLALLIANITFAKPLLPMPLLVNWQTVNNSQGHFICDLPEGYEYHTEDDVLFYAVRADSVAVEVHFAFDPNPPTLPLLVSPSNIDPITQALNAYTAYLVQITNGTVVNQTFITTNGKTGREIELTYYDTSNSTILRRIWMRVYWDGTKMHVFSLEAETTYDTTLTLYKDMLFNSIQFY